MISKYSHLDIKKYIVSVALFISIVSTESLANDKQLAVPGNFGLPGIIDLPTARHFPDGELLITHHNHRYSFMTGISFQALPRLGVSFRYGGLGKGGVFAQDRLTWDRSFNIHLSILDETNHIPAISAGLRDFIGTGWYSSEYIVGTKNIGNLELTAGLGFGRLAGRNSFSNPLSVISSGFEDRETNTVGVGGTLGSLNWFQGNASAFFGLNYRIGQKILVSAEYTPDLMKYESAYLEVKSPWNFGASYRLNNYVDISAQYLHGNQAAITTNIFFNPNRPPYKGGKELAPVPMRLRVDNAPKIKANNEQVIRKVLAADNFEIRQIKIINDTIYITVVNTKFRSISQAVGRVISTLQRFTSDNVKFAEISFRSHDLQVASYLVDLEKVTNQQVTPQTALEEKTSIKAIEIKPLNNQNIHQRITWGLGPYFAHRLFNPDLPLSVEVGLEFGADYYFKPGLKVSGAIRKSILTNLTDNDRRSNSVLPRVHSDWPLYDFAGQRGHIHDLALSYVTNFGSGFYGKTHAGFLEPFFAGIGGEILYKPASSSFAIGIDIHRVRKRDYDMRFDLLGYETTIGHLSFYYDAGRTLDLEINAGRYLAGDWGVTTTISRTFGSGWEVGGYATFTNVPFQTFGEGSFDKAIYVSVPIDWITSTPNKIRRRLNLRPITRDGGANMAAARSLYRHIERAQNTHFLREYGRLWK